MSDTKLIYAAGSLSAVIILNMCISIGAFCIGRTELCLLAMMISVGLGVPLSIWMGYIAYTVWQDNRPSPKKHMAKFPDQSEEDVARMLDRLEEKEVSGDISEWKLPEFTVGLPRPGDCSGWIPPKLGGYQPNVDESHMGNLPDISDFRPPKVSTALEREEMNTPREIDRKRIYFDTSEGRCFGNIKVKLSSMPRAAYLTVDLDDDSTNTLKKLYEFNAVTIKNQTWLQVGLDDGHYGCPEYQYVVL